MQEPEIPADRGPVEGLDYPSEPEVRRRNQGLDYLAQSYLDELAAEDSEVAWVSPEKGVQVVQTVKPL